MLYQTKRKLAKVSKTPGKTKLFNFFKCDNGYIVDFPGYGFSKVSKAKKESGREKFQSIFNIEITL